MYSAANINSSMVAANPRFSKIGFSICPTVFSSSKFCIFLLPICKTSIYGAVAIAWDRDSGTLYVYQEYKAKEKSAVEVARNLRSWGVQFATSHDAFNNTFQQGSSVADVFKDEGLHCFSAGREPWARIEKTRSLISDGKMFIFSDRCPELMKEMQTYHSKTSESDHGKIKIHKVDEDVIDAFTHAVMFYQEAQLKGVLGKPTPNFVIKQWEPSNKKYGV